MSNIYKDIEVDRNLYHLMNLLFDLDRYNFDSDIIRLLNELKTLVDKKLFANYDFSNYNIMSEKIVIRFLLNE